MPVKTKVCKLCGKGYYGDTVYCKECMENLIGKKKKEKIDSPLDDKNKET